MKNPLISFLKYINGMPVAFSMKHYQVFGDATKNLKNKELTSPESWDALRESHPFFSISSDREGWEEASELRIPKDGQDSLLRARAIDIIQLIRQEGITRVFSVGVGGAALEYQLKKLMPELIVVCSDYSNTTVERLQKVFVESDGIIQFDIVRGDWVGVQKSYVGNDGLCIMYRLDAGFSDTESKEIFKRMSEAGIQKVLVIPTGVLTLLSMYNRKRRELLWFLKRVPMVFCGYVRTKKRFQEQWRAEYGETELLLGGLKSFLLTKSIE
jgi:hypothetical protein